MRHNIGGKVKCNVQRILATVFSLWSFMCFLCGCSNQYEKALTLFEQGKWQEAMAESEKTPKEDSKLQYYIGVVHANGFGGVKKDRKAALSWYEKSASQDCVEGLLMCAQYYVSGDGGSLKNNKKAYEFIERAANLGSLEAKYKLGIFYWDGVGVVKDEVKGFKLIQETAKAGYGPGMLLTGWFFKEGKNVKKDLVEALKWFESAAAKGERDAMLELAGAYGLGPDSKYRIQKNFPKGVAYLKKSADLKLPQAQVLYGCYLMYRCYMGQKLEADKNVVPEDVKEGVKYILASAEQGNKDAMFFAGKIYWEGLALYGVERDEKKTIEFYSKNMEIYIFNYFFLSFST